MIHESEKLRSPNNIHDPDPRTEYFVVINDKNQLPRSITMEHQFENISKYILNQSVPENILIHFETAKNLYLYAWHVYRFYPVAEQQAFSTLEYALRLRLHEYVDQFKKENRGRVPTLRYLMKYAKDTELLRNDLFQSRLKWATQIARERLSAEMCAKMISSGLNEIDYDDSYAIPTEEDLNHDWLSSFIDSIPQLRNDLAHGASTLHRSVGHTFDVVSSIINQLYPE